MSEYGAMNWSERGKLKESDPKRFEKIKAEHEHQEAVLLNALKDVKTQEDFKLRKADLDIFNAGGDPWTNGPNAA